jgi:hypothetical protein
MASGKYKKKNRGANDASNRGSVHNVLVPMVNDNDKNEPHIPWSLLITVLVLCIVLVLVLPVMGIAYMDMNNATIAAMEEIRKMRELRAKILMQMQGEQ